MPGSLAGVGFRDTQEHNFLGARRPKPERAGGWLRTRFWPWNECGRMFPEELHQFEGRRVAKAAGYRGVVPGKDPDLEVVTQLWVRGFDTQRLREGESEAGVVLERPKESDEWHVECVRGAQHSVHHRQPHALSLIPGID